MLQRIVDWHILGENGQPVFADLVKTRTGGLWQIAQWARIIGTLRLTLQSKGQPVHRGLTIKQPLNQNLAQ
ncbi:hypothetical protein D3C85_1088940 [compost metagenome]